MEHLQGWRSSSVVEYMGSFPNSAKKREETPLQIEI